MKTIRKSSSLIIAFLFLWLVFSCSCKKAKEPETQPSGQQASALEGQAGGQESSGPSESVPVKGDWEESFKFVRDNIRFEPSRFPLKTSEGVIWSRSGNSLETALLLADLLQEKGKAVRLAEGRLDDADARGLLESVFGEKKDFSYKEGVVVSTPLDDQELLAAAKRHYWVQVEVDDRWVDLDPCFPRAVPGKAFASLENIYEAAEESLRTGVTISLEYEDEAGEGQPAFSWEGSLEEIANQPVSLSVVAEFQKVSEEDTEKEGEGGLGGVFGGITGKSSKEKKGKAAEKAFYNAELSAKGESLAEGRFSPEKGDITRLVLKLKFESLGEIVSDSERILFEKTDKNAELPLFQRHAILITGNRIPAAAWEAAMKEVADKSLLGGVKSRVEEIKKNLKSKKDLKNTLEQSLELEKKMGPDLGHLINMVFASSSDDLTEQEGKALAVCSYYAVPRILITTVQGDQEKAEVTLDLRQDRVEAIPLPGQAAAMRNTFLYGRGVMESILEGNLLALLTGKKALTTALLMQEAAQQNIPIRMYSSLEKGSLEDMDMPDHVRQKALAVVDSGRVIIIPEKEVEWDGEGRWGWWNVDPGTWETIGVLDTGLHQAVLERTILEEKGPLQSKMGYVVGAIVGAVDTQWLIAGMVLKYGELNKAALEEAKAYMKNIQAYMCPGFEKKISAGVGVTLVDIEDCFKFELEAKVEAGVEIKQAWCENFAKGFACASTSILNYYLSQAE